MLYQGLGKRIRQQRQLAQMTQEKLAEAAGISLSFLGHIERGTRKASLDTLVRICNVLKVSPQLLLQDSLEGDLLGMASVFSPSKARLMREISHAIDESEYFGKDFE